MLRKLIATGLVSLAIASCGSGSATPSPSASGGATSSTSPSSSAETSSVAPTSSETPTASLPANTMTAACDSVALRTKANTTSGLVVRVKKGTVVHVAATVEGAAYTPGTCGIAGTSWLKIDKVGAKTVKALYGSSFVYAAAGLFQ